MQSPKCIRPRPTLVVGMLVGVLLGGGLLAGNTGCDQGAPSIAPSNWLTGTVTDTSGEQLAAVTVRIQGRAPSARTNTRGVFRLSDPGTRPLRMTASREGFVIAGRTVDQSDPTSTLNFELRSLPAEDDPEYVWVDPRPDATDANRCGNCHEEIYDEWAASAHADAASNVRLLDLYNGTDAEGNRDIGWNLRADHPDGIGVCAACHAPGVDFEAGTDTDLMTLRGTPTLGVHCDFCHKVREIAGNLDGRSHGRFGVQLLRPREGQLFFGPLDDVSRNEDTFSPLQTQSQYCASCHEGIVFGMPVYTTYSEWQASPARQDGKQCQSCHMAATGHMTNIAPGAGGIERHPATLASHTMFPRGQAEELRKCLQVTASLLTDKPNSDSVSGAVRLSAHDVGHRVPTGLPDRHLILVVEPFDDQGSPAEQIDGPRLPDSAGSEFAGLPGRIFAKLMVDEDGNSPTPFWRAFEVASDSRLHPEETRTVTFRFAPTTSSIRVRLLYRRFWSEVTVAKGWPDDTILISDFRTELSL